MMRTTGSVARYTPSLRRARLPILISAAAGAGRPRRAEPAIRAALGDRFELDVRYPATLDELRDGIAREVRAGTAMVAIGGGDGTLHHAVNAIGDAPVTLAPLPLGTGNDFCRSLGLGPGLDLAFAALRDGSVRVVDQLLVQGRRVLTVAGLGLVADSALLVHALARPGRATRPVVRALGSAAYLGITGLRLLGQPGLAREASVSWRGAEGGWTRVGGRWYGVVLACRPTLGAGLRLPLVVADDDGLVELVLVEPRARLRVALHLPRLRSGARIPDDLLTVHQAVEIAIEWAGGTRVVGDGEDLGVATAVTARVLPAALRVVAPQAPGAMMRAT